MATQSDMLYTVTRSKRYGYIDCTGNIVIPIEYQMGRKFSDGLALVRKNGEEFAINASGERVFGRENLLGACSRFSEGLCKIVNDAGDRFGYIDKCGEEVIPCIFEEAYTFCHGRAIVTMNGKMGVIDKSGRFIVPPVYSTVRSFMGLEDYAVFKNEKKLWGILHIDGKISCKPRFDVMYNFSEGVAATREDGSWGFVDCCGDWVMRPRFDDIRGFFSESLVGVGIKDSHGFIDHDGNVMVDFQYSDVGIFSEGLATVRVGGDWSAVEYVRGGKCGVIDREGRMVVPPLYDGVGEYCGGLAQVDVGNLEEGDFKSGYIDRQGNVLWDPSK